MSIIIDILVVHIRIVEYTFYIPIRSIYARPNYARTNKIGNSICIVFRFFNKLLGFWRFTFC